MGGPGYSRSAAGSHHRHDAYMNEFHEAYAALEQGGGGGGPGGRASLPGPSGSSLPVARGRPSAGGTAVVLEEGYDKGGSLGAAGKAAGPARAPVMGGGGWFRGPRDPQGEGGRELPWQRLMLTAAFDASTGRCFPLCL